MGVKRFRRMIRLENFVNSERRTWSDTEVTKYILNEQLAIQMQQELSLAVLATRIENIEEILEYKLDLSLEGNSYGEDKQTLKEIKELALMYTDDVTEE